MLTNIPSTQRLVKNIWGAYCYQQCQATLLIIPWDAHKTEIKPRLTGRDSHLLTKLPWHDMIVNNIKENEDTSINVLTSTLKMKDHFKDAVILKFCIIIKLNRMQQRCDLDARRSSLVIQEHWAFKYFVAGLELDQATSWEWIQVN